MEIKYKNRKIEDICTNAYIAEKKYGIDMAVKIQTRIDQIRASYNVEMMIRYKIGRCHALHNNRKGQYALDLVNPYRLIFRVENDKVQIANIIEIVDYH